MARKRDPQRRAQILAAALELFAARGAQNTSTAEISKAAGIAAGTLFLYFPTRQALIDALALEIAAGQAAAARARLAGAGSARAAFAAIWHGTIDWFRANPLAYQWITQVRDSGLISAAATQDSAALFGYYFEAIQRGLAEGSLGAYPPELVGDLLYHAIVAVMNSLLRQPDAAAQQRLIEQGFEIFWKGISA